MDERLHFPFLQPSLPSERPAIRKLAAEASARLAARMEELTVAERNWLSQNSLEKGVAIVDLYRPRQPASVVASGVPKLERELLALGGEAWSGIYRRLLLLQLLALLAQRIPAWKIPELAWEGMEPALKALLEGCDQVTGTSWADGDFRKDLAAAQLRVFPFDGMVTEVIPFRPRTGARHATIAERLRLAMHLHIAYALRRWWITSHSWRGFREQRRNPGRIVEGRVAAIVALNATIAGRVISGWMHDPQVALTTPHLAAKAAEMLAMGGRRIRSESGRETVRLAVASSEERRRLYEAGRYAPRNYSILVRRADILAWAQRDRLATPDERAAADQAAIDRRAPGR